MNTEFHRWCQIILSQVASTADCVAHAADRLARGADRVADSLAWREYTRYDEERDPGTVVYLTAADNSNRSKIR